MKKAYLPSTENSICNVLEHFFHINRERMEFTRQSLSPQQADFIDLLPMLFHHNHPQFPGYVSQSTPCGIAQYNPMQKSLHAAKKLFKSFQHKRRAQFKMEIVSMFFMGSSGSIAYSKKSDFDIWLIHEEGISSERLQELRKKAELIENWATDLKLEVHFFIFDSSSFRNGTLESLSSESSGSSQHRLLLDEFYRSSLLIAGRYPLWWLVPPEQEHNYDAYVNDLISKRFIDSNEVVDFGPVAPIPANEFFGAAIWQLYKGINSPYKSVIKLLLMEAYASEHPEIQLLSIQYKELIYRQENDLSVLDPYIIMYRKIAEYLMTRQDKERLDTFRESFYLKINEKLSQKIKSTKISPRRKIFEDLMLEWGWEERHYRNLDNNSEWHIDNIKQERAKLTHVLTKSYHFLSDFARRNADVYRISEFEMNVLGRKLYAAFDKKNGKIEIINRGIAPNPAESEVTLIQNRNKNGQKQWLLYRDRKQLQTIGDQTPLHRTADLMPLLVWCHLNQIVTKETFVLIKTQDDQTTLADVHKTLNILEDLFPGGKRPEASFTELSTPAYISSAAIFLNLGGTGSYANSRNEHIASDRVDPLSYGALHRNLIHSFDLLITTSWEEVLVYRYENLSGMLQMVTDLAKWSSNKEKLSSCRFQCFCHTASHGEMISLRMQELLRDMVKQLMKTGMQTENRRYLFTAEDRYYLLENNRGELSYQDNISLNHLMNYLQKPNQSFSSVTFDRKGEWDNVLPYIYRLNQTSVIQLFFLINNSQVELYILDEKGSLFHQVMSFYHIDILISHFERFFVAVQNRKRFMTGDFSPIENIARDYYEIRKDNRNKPSISRFSSEHVIDGIEDEYIDLKVIGSMSEEEQTNLSIYCNDREFSSLEHGNQLFSAVAEYVITLRDSKKSYPIYITDIDFSSGIFNVIEPEQLQTIHFLQFKSRIEKNLNKSLLEVSRKELN